MPKKGRSRKALRRVRISSEVTVGALAALDVVAGGLTNNAVNTLRFISLNASYSWANKTASDDALTFGVAHSDYTAAEIEECLEAFESIDLGDKIAQEKANRLVREIGTISGQGDTAGAFNGGRKIKTRLNWLMAIGDNLQLFIRNASGAVYTTGSTVTVNGDLWVKD